MLKRSVVETTIREGLTPYSEVLISRVVLACSTHLPRKQSDQSGDERKAQIDFLKDENWKDLCHLMYGEILHQLNELRLELLRIDQTARSGVNSPELKYDCQRGWERLNKLIDMLESGL